jgi:hypothetical protein
MTLASHDNGEYREITYGILQKCSTDLASVNVNALAEQILHIGAKFLWLKRANAHSFAHSRVTNALYKI